jgi:hypothetical protein
VEVHVSSDEESKAETQEGDESEDEGEFVTERKEPVLRLCGSSFASN